MTAGVYRITNIANGKSYIGISNDIEKRWKDEISGSNINKGYNSAIESAIRKYGKDYFHFEILEVLEDADDRYEAEKMFIKRYNTMAPNGYNLTEGGEGLGSGENHPNYGKHLSEETKDKMSKANKGKTPWNKGIPQTEEAKLKMSKAKKGENNPEAKYDLWDISYIKYLKREMYRRGREPNPCKCFRLKHKGKEIPIGLFYEWTSIEIINDIINEETNKTKSERIPWILNL